MTALCSEAIMFKEIWKDSISAVARGGQKHNQGNFNRNPEAWKNSERIGRWPRGGTMIRQTWIHWIMGHWWFFQPFIWAETDIVKLWGFGWVFSLITFLLLPTPIFSKALNQGGKANQPTEW